VIPSLKDEFEIMVHADYLEERGELLARSLRFHRPLTHDGNERTVWNRPFRWGRDTGSKDSRFVVTKALFDLLEGPFAELTSTADGTKHVIKHMREYDTLEAAMLDYIQAWRKVYQ
jgi:hypothetical protein